MSAAGTPETKKPARRAVSILPPRDSNVGNEVDKPLNPKRVSSQRYRIVGVAWTGNVRNAQIEVLTAPRPHQTAAHSSLPSRGARSRTRRRKPRPGFTLAGFGWLRLRLLAT